MSSQIPSAAESAGHAAAPRLSAADEHALLVAVLQKDRKAAAEFVSRYADPVYAYVWQRLAPTTDLVEDVVQEVFLAALDKLHTFAGESSVLGWLLGIARHKVEDVYRARLREPELVSDLDLELGHASHRTPKGAASKRWRRKPGRARKRWSGCSRARGRNSSDSGRTRSRDGRRTIFHHNR